MKKMKKLVCFALAVIMVVAGMPGNGLKVKAADPRSTNVSSFAAYKNGGAGFVEFALENGDWQTAESLTAPGATWMENNYLYNVIFYQGEDDTEGTSLHDAMSGELYYNFFGRGNSLAMGLKADIYANITKVYIPAGTVFPSYQVTGGSTPFNGVNGDDVAADTSVGAYITTEDMLFVGESSSVAGEWKIWSVAKKTAVDSVTINIEGDTAKRLTFNIAGDADNDAIPSWGYIGGAIHGHYNTKEYVQIYLKGQTEPKTLTDFYKTTDGNLYFNLYNAGSMTFPLLDSFGAASEVEKIVIKAGCQFPAVSYTGATLGSGGTVSATTTTAIAYVVEEDTTFLLSADATANRADFVFEDTSVTAPTQVLGVKTGHSNNNVTFTLSANDYAGLATNRPSEKFKQYNFMDMVQIHSGETVQTLRDVYPNGGEIYYNLWGVGDTLTIALGSAYNTVTKIVIPAGTVFPSATYTGYGAWDATSIPDNMNRSKGGFETTEEIVYVKPAEHGEWTVWEGAQSNITKITNVHVRGGGSDYRLMLFLSENDYTEQVNVDFAKLSEYNALDNIVLYDIDGNEYVLKDIATGNAYYKCWTDADSIGFGIRADLPVIAKVVIKAGCELPTYSYTNDGASTKTHFLVENETTFTLTKEVTDNTDSSNNAWYRDEILPIEEQVTGINNLHVRQTEDGLQQWLLVFLSNHDYAEAASNFSVNAAYLRKYNFLDNIMLYTTSGKELALKDYNLKVANYNKWGEKGCIAIQLQLGLDPINKIAFKKGCEFPSFTYQKGEATTDLRFVLSKDVTLECDTTPTDNKTNTSWSEAIPIVKEETKITKIHIRGGNQLLLFLSNNDYGTEDHYVSIDPTKLSKYNTLEKITLYTNDGQSYTLTDKAQYNIWTEVGCIAYEFDASIARVDKVVIQAGCELPSREYTNGGGTTQLTYVVENETIFTNKPIQEDNGFSINWTRVNTRNIETTVTGVNYVDDVLSVALEESDYGTEKLAMSEKHVDYGYLKAIRVYTTDTEFVTLEEALGGGEAYFNANNTLEFAINVEPIRIVIPSYTVFPTKAYVNDALGEKSGYEVLDEKIFVLKDGVWEDKSMKVSRTYGDANGDKNLNSLDLVRMKRYFKDGYGMNNFGNCDDEAEINGKDIVLLRKAIVGSYTLHPYVKESSDLTIFASEDAKLDFFLNDFFKRHAGYVDYVEGEMTATTYRPGEGFEGMFNTKWVMEASTWYSSKGFDINSAEVLKGWLSTVPVDKYGYVWNGNDTVEDPMTDLEGAKHAMGWPLPNADHANADFKNKKEWYTDGKSVYWDFNKFDDENSEELLGCIWTNNIGATVESGLYAGKASGQSEVYFEVADMKNAIGTRGSIVQTEYAPWLALDLRMTMDDLSDVEDIYVWYTTSTGESYSTAQRISVKETAPIWYDMVGTDYAHMLYVPMYTQDGWYSGNGELAEDGAKDIYKIKIEIVPTDEAKTLTGTFALNYVRPTFDTRYSNNNALFISTIREYYDATGDAQFLAEYITKARKAMNFLMQMYDETKNLNKQSYLFGHYGRTTELCNGMMNGYWDVMYTPIYDFQSNMYFYEALRDLSYLEKEMDKAGITVSESTTIETATIDGIGSAEYEAAGQLDSIKADVLAAIRTTFWNEGLGRFVAGEDNNGNVADNGHVVWNLQAIESGIATEDQAAAIMKWIDGDQNMYKHVLAPMTNTIDNLESNMYSSFYERTGMKDNGIGKFGHNVQNGGAVMYSSYYDLMSRVQVKGADDAYGRLTAIRNWYVPIAESYDHETENAKEFYYNYFNEQGKPYYYLQNGSRENTGNGIIGLDGEFPESLLAVAAVPRGFFGIENINTKCLGITPELPSDLQHWKIENMAFGNAKYDVSIFHGVVRVDSVEGNTAGMTMQIALDYTEGQTVYINEEATTDYTVQDGKAIVTVAFDDVVVEVR